MIISFKIRNYIQRYKLHNNKGRSMVEMLGVLAIIGVLSIGGIQGYTLSMRRYKANEIIDVANKYATAAFATCQARLQNNPEKYKLIAPKNTSEYQYSCFAASTDAESNSFKLPPEIRSMSISTPAVKEVDGQILIPVLVQFIPNDNNKLGSDTKYKALCETIASVAGLEIDKTSTELPYNKPKANCNMPRGNYGLILPIYAN